MTDSQENQKILRTDKIGKIILLKLLKTQRIRDTPNSKPTIRFCGRF